MLELMPILTHEEYELFKSYAERELAWGSVHIVMDDGNLEDDMVQYCMNWACVNDDADGFEIALILSERTLEQREMLYQHKWR